MKEGNDAVRGAQNALYIWLSKFESRSIEVIKASCDSLNESWDLQLANPVWTLFWPMVYNGVADHVGNGCYALTESLCLDFDTHHYYINYKPKGKYKPTKMIGVNYSEDVMTEQNIKKVKSIPLSILKHFPTVKSVVDGFPKSLQDTDLLSYYNYKTKKGIAKLESSGLTRYFSVPEEMYLRELPSRDLNPEAFAIAYCYSRVINEEGNGLYRDSDKTLRIPRFAFPFMLYRVLLIEGMKYKTLPIVEGESYLFKNISLDIFRELNRILCNSIEHE